MGLGYDSPLVQLESLEREFGGLLREERRGIGDAIIDFSRGDGEVAPGPADPFRGPRRWRTRVRHLSCLWGNGYLGIVWGRPTREVSKREVAETDLWLSSPLAVTDPNTREPVSSAMRQSRPHGSWESFLAPELSRRACAA